MAQRAIDATGTESSYQSPSRTAPTLGMRGGLGKSLLIAFLLLAIVPLGLLALLTNNRIQYDTQQELLDSMEAILSLKEAHLIDWVESYEHELSLLASTPGLDTGLSERWSEVQAVDPALLGLFLFDQVTGETLASAGAAVTDLNAVQPLLARERRLLVVPPAVVGEPPLVAVGYAWDGRDLVGLLSWDALQQIVAGPEGTEGGIQTCLVTGDGLMASAQGLMTLPLEGQESLPEDIARALQGGSGAGAYDDWEGVPVFGAYRWNPELQVALLAKQPQTRALSAGDNLTAVVVGATLAVALITAAIAAVVTRRITRPIVQLTETAAWMARGDLNQKVPIVRKDEIGVLARAFNRMAAELRMLYADLEAKVAQRTRQLEEANERTVHHATQLALSAEVARIATSIRDVDSVLITGAFELRYVSIYLLDDSGKWAVWQAGSDTALSPPECEQVGGPSLVGRVAAEGQFRVVHGAQKEVPAIKLDNLISTTSTGQLPVVCEMAVPLRSRDQVLGVLHLQSSRPDDFGGDDQMVYQSLADQISIAIRNARAYALERETVEKLRELDRIQALFLTNMSHALRTPLTSVIGFSRVLLKELDGPLTDLQRTDLETIHQSGRQLLGLINDMLELSHLELGTAPFTLAEVDLSEIVEGVMATARALARGKPVRVYEEMPDELPPLYTDGARLRQVILALVSNAVKYTDEGSVRLRVTVDDEQVVISVRDTGIGITEVERASLFRRTPFDDGGEGNGTNGFGLAISKRVVEKLGGEIWMESEEGVGSVFTFTLPIQPKGGIAGARDEL
jgi:signal transduction histidine kinase